MTKNGAATKEDIKRLERKISGTDSGVTSLKSNVRGLKSDIKSLESKISKSEIKILSEIKDLREDFSAHQFSHMRINDDLIEHDSRLKKLETTATV